MNTEAFFSRPITIFLPLKLKAVKKIPQIKNTADICLLSNCNKISKNLMESFMSMFLNSLRIPNG